MSVGSGLGLASKARMSASLNCPPNDRQLNENSPQKTLSKGKGETQTHCELLTLLCSYEHSLTNRGSLLEIKVSAGASAPGTVPGAVHAHSEP